ncbi:unnamed protein product [Rotaria magnacalcarata]|uniref:Uncharacterized protein n=1 Tax=Rotaria magnacalcarata TaxID=392030 RepID=A0A819JDG3_9BILA|nr:unnamed protein product [Rotaria magnacalcarata]CAF2088761.1 unnamed protein product [Rotaria magnacalcarata]CAF3928422.1 unnamed protein product [Rotaria magnacalcarata]CAF4022130.1 unnamed protein product [Rotaria magnacalcarata]
MSNMQHRTKLKNKSISSAKDRISDNELSIPIPSRQEHLNDRTDFTLDPSLIFDELPQPFRRINKVLESIFDDAWAIIEQREKQRLIDQTKFVSAQHTSSTIINTPFPISMIGSHISGTLCFFNGIQNEQAYLVCYDNQIDEIINSTTVENPLQNMIVFKSDSSIKDTIYFLSVIDKLGYWKMFAYKNQQFYLLFIQYETDDDSKRPICLMTQVGLGDEYLVVSWFGNNDSWLEVYKLPKEQWKSEITTQEQATTGNENQIEENASQQSTENRSKLIRTQFSRPALLFKTKAPKFSPGSNNFPQLMKNTENQSNIGLGILNHFYTQQIIDAKMLLIRDLVMPTTNDASDQVLQIPKFESYPPIIPSIVFIPAKSTTAGAVNCLAVSWSTTNQLLIYKIAKSESKGKDAFDTRPIIIWPFASRITSLAYDSKHEHLAAALQSGNVCIIERKTGFNDPPSIQNVSPSQIIDMRALDTVENSFNIDTHDRHNGIFVLSNDGQIYRVKFKSILNEEKNDEQQNVVACFPQQQNKDTSKIVRILFFNCNPANLFVSINELNRIYINDALKCKQLCEIVLPQTKNDHNDNHNNSSIQIAFLDNARSIIIGVPENTNPNQENMPSFLRLYRVPLEHFPSLENYYPERIISTLDEIESIPDTKPAKNTSSQTRKSGVTAEIDKFSLQFDEKIKEMFRTRQSYAYERRERLRGRWNEIKLHFNPVYEQIK